MLSALRADLQANRPNPLISVVLIVYRYGNWVVYGCRLKVVKPFLWFVYRLLDMVFVRMMCCAELDAHCRIGAGLRLPHGANGIIIHKDSVIGRNVTIYHQVTLGGRNEVDSQPPTLEDDVEIFAGAKVLGSVQIGEGAVIGANAVVIKDVPARCLAVGVPARIIDKRRSSVLAQSENYD